MEKRNNGAAITGLSGFNSANKPLYSIWHPNVVALYLSALHSVFGKLQVNTPVNFPSKRGVDRYGLCKLRYGAHIRVCTGIDASDLKGTVNV